jgi:hypothetical protein
MQDRSFLFKVVYLTIVMFNDLNVVLLATLVPTRVEVAGILVPFDCCPNFGSRPP